MNWLKQNWPAISKWINQNWFRLGILFIGLLVAFSFYQSLVVIPRERDAQKLRDQIIKDSTERLQKSQNQTNLNSCLSAAEIDYSINWDSQCKTFGVNKKTDGCTLPKYNADTVEKWRTDAKAECFRKYPVN